MGSIRSIVVAALASGSTAALVVAAPPASAQTGSLTLSLSNEFGGNSRTVTLTCDPVGGTHPDGAAACVDLTAAGGDITRIPRVIVNCPDFFEPVIAQAQGTWLGNPISFNKTFVNLCFAINETGGHVFHF